MAILTGRQHRRELYPAIVATPGDEKAPELGDEHTGQHEGTSEQSPDRQDFTE